ncbi:hypothetical protein Y1Q_0001815 [Alligator mississippiensis]|uniref:Uncharacterized protein n=1 Tax=Alligator mississippiensis TaxID=8496 RepID=A0A151MKW4_ALLMI|nr:hypothetical protein Y1Q_0001815 [Alligator mississippiensis]
MESHFLAVLQAGALYVAERQAYPCMPSRFCKRCCCREQQSHRTAPQSRYRLAMAFHYHTQFAKLVEELRFAFGKLVT